MANRYILARNASPEQSVDSKQDVIANIRLVENSIDANICEIANSFQKEKFREKLLEYITNAKVEIIKYAIRGGVTILEPIYPNIVPQKRYISNQQQIVIQKYSKENNVVIVCIASTHLLIFCLSAVANSIHYTTHCEHRNRKIRRKFAVGMSTMCTNVHRDPSRLKFTTSSESTPIAS